MRPRGVEVDDDFFVGQRERVQGDVGAVRPRAPVVRVECHFCGGAERD